MLRPPCPAQALHLSHARFSYLALELVVYPPFRGDRSVAGHAAVGDGSAVGRDGAVGEHRAVAVYYCAVGGYIRGRRVVAPNAQVNERISGPKVSIVVETVGFIYTNGQHEIRYGRGSVYSHISCTGRVLILVLCAERAGRSFLSQ